MNHPIQTIPGISYRTAAAIIAEIGDFSLFDSPDKILAHAGMDPTTLAKNVQKESIIMLQFHMQQRNWYVLWMGK